MRKICFFCFVILLSFMSCVSAPPPGTERFDNFVSVTGIAPGNLLKNLYIYGDQSAEILSKRIMSGRDTIDVLPDSDSTIIEYVQEEGGRVFRIPTNQLNSVEDKEAYISVILQYSNFMSASTVNYKTAFSTMFSMARKIKNERKIQFPDWIEKGIVMNPQELESYRKNVFNEDKFVFSFK